MDQIGRFLQLQEDVDAAPGFGAAIDDVAQDNHCVGGSRRKLAQQSLECHIASVDVADGQQAAGFCSRVRAHFKSMSNSFSPAFFTSNTIPSFETVAEFSMVGCGAK